MSDTPALLPAREPVTLIPERHPLADFVYRHPTVVLGGGILAALAIISIAAPLLSRYDPLFLDVTKRMQPPSFEHWFGTDAYGRDVLSRTLYGGRVSLIVGICVAALSTIVGCIIGLVSGYFRTLDAIIMRIMDGLMAIPGILLAIAMMALLKPSLGIVIIAITIPDIPRVVRLVRGVVLSIREQPYVQAAVSIGTRFPRLLFKHVLPNTIPPLIVQATYICASAVLAEAYLSFLGVGIPPETPSWGNIIAEGRLYVQIAFWSILFPGVFLGMMVLAINILGDGLRDMLDPRIASKM
ncbi:MAG: ABC transporter permease [Gammaproteobacteria bacterium]|nr:ABC transporter permease [Gammaproteobacteria bacterium]